VKAGSAARIAVHRSPGFGHLRLHASDRCWRWTPTA